MTNQLIEQIQEWTEQGNIEEITSLLSQYKLKNIDLNIQNATGYSPLSLAVKYGNIERGLTPLMIACQHEHKHIIKLLLECQADITVQDCFGKTCQDRVRQPEIKKIFEHYLLDQNKKKIENNEYFYEKRARSTSIRLIEKYKQKIQSGDSGKKSGDYLDLIVSSKKKQCNANQLLKIQPNQNNYVNYLTTNQNQLITENEEKDNPKYFSTAKQKSHSCVEQEQEQQQQNYLLQQAFRKNKQNDKNVNNNSTIKTQKIDQLKQLIFEKYYPNYTSVQDNQESQQIKLISKQKKEECSVKNIGKQSLQNSKDERLTKTEITDLIANQFNQLSEKLFSNISTKISQQIESQLTLKEKLLVEKIKQKMYSKNYQGYTQQEDQVDTAQVKNYKNYALQSESLSNQTTNLISLERTSSHTNFKKPTIATSQLNDAESFNPKPQQNINNLDDLKLSIQNEIQYIYKKLELSLKGLIKQEVETQCYKMNEKIVGQLLLNKSQSQQQQQVDKVFSNKSLSTKSLLQQNNNILNFCKLNSNTQSKLKKSQNESQIKEAQLISSGLLNTKPKFEDIKTIFNIQPGGQKKSYDSSIGPLIVSQFLVENQQNYKLRQTSNKAKNNQHSKIQTNENLVLQTKFN